MAFNEFLDVLKGDIWEERPLSFVRFCEEIIGNKSVAPLQVDIGERMSQILRYETLVDLHGKDEADRLWAKTAKDNCLIIGKGGSKNFITQLAFLYIIYTLLCMKDPQGYYGRDPDDNIDLVNMATSARQASNGFFNKMVSIVKRVPWFQGKFHPRAIDISFDKHITLHSLHSRPEAAEALNILAVVLDEVDSPEVDGKEMYDYLSGTVTSRFPDLGKVVMLSFPRSKDGFIMNFYNDAVGDRKIVTEVTRTFKLDSSLPDGVAENEFDISWEEEVVTGTKYDNVYCAKYPAYKVNPIAQLDGYTMALYRDPDDALMRFFANPPAADENAFFRNHEKLHLAFSQQNGWQDDSIVCHPNPDANYYIHVDLSSVSDSTVVAMSHIEKWVQVDMGSMQSDPKPLFGVDLLRVWKPTRTNPVNHSEVVDFVMQLCKKFNVQLVTFDQWHSFDHIRHLNEVGIRAEKKSLALAEYIELRMAIMEERLLGPSDDDLLDELKKLIIINGKVDHKARHHNDMAEAICGSVRNCIENEIQDSAVQIITLKNIYQAENNAQLRKLEEPGRVAPSDIKEWINGFRSI